MTISKSFLSLWLSLLMKNEAFIQDNRLTSDLVGGASSGDMKALAALLTIYRQYANESKDRIGPNMFPSPLEGAQSRIRELVPPLDVTQSIDDMIRVIESGELSIF